MALRWKLLIGLGAALSALGVFVDWPPKPDPSLPDTQSFLVLLGGILCAAGMLIGLRREK